jgi:hypothetical protein
MDYRLDMEGDDKGYYVSWGDSGSEITSSAKKIRFSSIFQKYSTHGIVCEKAVDAK